MRALSRRYAGRTARARPQWSSPSGTLVGELHKLRCSLPAHAWRQWAEVQVRGHALYPVLLEDPFVRHSAERPRGYPGDAELLDYIYESGNIRPALEQASDLGRRLYDYTHMAPAPAAVRSRLDLAIAEIERLAAAGGTAAHSLGRLRPPARSAALAACATARWGGLWRSIRIRSRSNWCGAIGQHRGVEVREGSALGLIRNGPAGLRPLRFHLRAWASTIT